MGGPYQDENGHLQRPPSSGKGVGDGFVMAPASKPMIDLQGSRKPPTFHVSQIGSNVFTPNPSPSIQLPPSEIAYNQAPGEETNDAERAEVARNGHEAVYEEHSNRPIHLDQLTQQGESNRCEHDAVQRQRQNKPSARKRNHQSKPTKPKPLVPPPQPTAEDVFGPVITIPTAHTASSDPPRHDQAQVLLSHIEDVSFEHNNATEPSHGQTDPTRPRPSSRGQPYQEQVQPPQQSKSNDVGYKDLFNLVPLLVDQEVQHKEKEHQAKLEASKARNKTLREHSKTLEQQLFQAKQQIADQQQRVRKVTSGVEDLNGKRQEFQQHMKGLCSDINVLKQEFCTMKNNNKASDQERFHQDLRAAHGEAVKRIAEIESTYSKVIREHQAVNKDLLARLEMAEQRAHELQIRLNDSCNMFADQRDRNDALESKLCAMKDQTHEFHVKLEQDHQRTFESVINVKEVISKLLEDVGGDSMLLNIQNSLESSAEHQESTRDALKSLEYKVLGVDTRLNESFVNTTHDLKKSLDPGGHLDVQIQNQFGNLEAALTRNFDLSERILKLELEKQQLSICLADGKGAKSQINDQLISREKELGFAQEEISQLKERLSIMNGTLQNQGLELETKLEASKRREEAANDRAGTAEMALRASEGRAKNLQEQLSLVKCSVPALEHVAAHVSYPDHHMDIPKDGGVSVACSPPKTPSADKQKPLLIPRKPHPDSIQISVEEKDGVHVCETPTRVLRPRNPASSKQESQKGTAARDAKKGPFRRILEDPFSEPSADALTLLDSPLKKAKRQRFPDSKLKVAAKKPKVSTDTSD